MGQMVDQVEVELHQHHRQDLERVEQEIHHQYHHRKVVRVEVVFIKVVYIFQGEVVEEQLPLELQVEMVLVQDLQDKVEQEQLLL
jgi:nickel-dependent lactate racemase